MELVRNILQTIIDPSVEVGQERTRNTQLFNIIVILALISVLSYSLVRLVFVFNFDLSEMVTDEGFIILLLSVSLFIPILVLSKFGYYKIGIFLFVAIGIVAMISLAPKYPLILSYSVLLLLLASVFLSIKASVFVSTFILFTVLVYLSISSDYTEYGILFDWAFFHIICSFALLVFVLHRKGIEDDRINSLKLAEDKFKILTETTNAGIFIADNDEIIYANKAAISLTGYTLDELHQIKLSEILISDSKDKNNRIRLNNKDNNELWVETSHSNVVVNHVEMVLMTVFDVTQNKINEAQLIAAKNEANQSKKIKDEFIANMSHEIRTPMNGIIGMSNLLLSTSLASDQSEYLEGIRTSSEHLLSIINNILDLSKIDSRNMKITSELFNFNDVISSSVQNVEIVAIEKNLYLNSEISAEIPDQILGDPLRLKQIVLNLLSNAVKFTNEGGVTVRSSLVNRKKNLISILIEVSDTGIGIPDDSRKDIYTEFSQVDSRGTQGTGLGLSITKRLVELQNGEISYKSEVGVGTTFSVKLKYHLPISNTGRKAHIKKSTHNFSELEGISVLLVEDDKVNQIVTSKILEKQGVIVDVCSSPDNVVDKVNLGSYDLILMDISLGSETDGYQITKRIRNDFNSATSEIPIIAFSAHVFEKEFKKALDSGMDDYISKPFMTNDLYEMILKYVKKN